ncbi:transforming growth factor beta-1-induced transcript 1 protein-like isoform X2 [Glandiceps talaboti]
MPTCGKCKLKIKLSTMPTCRKCKLKIKTGTLIKALGKKWHPQCFTCFTCAECKSELRGKAFFQGKDGQPLCETDYKKLEAAKCEKCKDPVIGEIVCALGGKWHPKCFVCTECKKPFKDGSFSVNEGKPYCTKDYEKKFLGGKKKPEKCKGCKDKIETQWVEAIGHSWHPGCFVCKVLLLGMGSGDAM